MFDSELLTIVYQDEYLVVIDKPSGLLVHRSWIASDAKQFAMQMLRDQLGQHVFPVHRLDRPTLERFKQHNIGYVVYNGGNDSQDTVNKLYQFPSIKLKQLSYYKC